MPFLLFAVIRWLDGPGLREGDHAHYLMHTKALVEGRGYTDTGYIYTSDSPYIGPAAQPPGLPLTFYPVVKLFGFNITLLRLIVAGFAVVYLLVAGSYFAMHGSPRLGLGVAMLSCLAPDVVHVATQLFTDIPFCALVWSVIWIFDRPGAWNWRRTVAVTLLGGA